MAGCLTRSSAIDNFCSSVRIFNDGIKRKIHFMYEFLLTVSVSWLRKCQGDRYILKTNDWGDFRY